MANKTIGQFDDGGAAVGTDKILIERTGESEYLYLEVQNIPATVEDGDKGDITVSTSGTVWIIDNGAVTNAKVASGIDAVKIGSGNVSNTEFGYLDGVTSSIQTQLTSNASAASTAQTTANNANANAGTALTAANLALTEARKEYITIACSDETTALTTGTAKATFRIPFAGTLTGVRASLTTAQGSGSILTVDVNKNGTTVLSTKLTIDNTEKTSTTAATPPVISVSSIADDDEFTIDIDQVGTSGATGLKVTLIISRT